MSPRASRGTWLLAAACIALLSSCKDQTAPANTPAAPPKSDQASTVASAFDKPLKPEGPLTLVLITNGIAPFWETMGQGMKQAERELQGESVTVTWKGPEKADNADQKQLFETAVASSVNGICVSPVQAEAFAPVIDSAIDNNIPVITFDSDADRSKRLVYLGTDNYQAGRRAGEEAIRIFPNGAHLVAFVGNMTAQNARDRYRGFKDAVDGHKIDFLQDPFEDDKSQERATRNAADAITRYGTRLNGMLGLYSYDGPAIINAVTAANVRSRMKILCFDGDAGTLEGLRRNMVDLTVVQKPYEFGRLATKLLYLINRKGLAGAMAALRPELDQLGMTVKGNVIDTGVTVVTPANAAEFLQELQKKGLKST